MPVTRPESLNAPAGTRQRRRPWSTHFLDVSNNNGAVDWRVVARNAKHTGITAVAMKATEGVSFHDHLYAKARADCFKYGLRTFAYHYARPDEHPGSAGAIAEAEFFCNVVGEVPAYEWRPMLDFEEPPFFEGWARTWILHVWNRLGVAPVLYSYWAALASMHLAKPLGAGLVFAFPNGQPAVAPVPPPWRHWTAHQYSWHGRTPGVGAEVDLNWAPNVWPLLAYPVRGAAWEPRMKARRRRA